MTNPMCIKEGEGIIPVYKTVAGVSQTNLRDIAKKALESLGSQMQETLPDSVRTRYTLCTREYATRNIHFPISGEALMRAKMRFEFERFMTYFYMVKRYRKEREQQKGVNLNATTILEDYEGCLSFDLTDAQKRVINEIARDISGDRPMGRLVQGDVGSGKTAVAMFLIYAAVNAGRQAVFMAPTEILAEQHYNNLKTIFGDKACLLRGGMSVAEKRASLENIRTGKCLAIAGTHALLSQDVEFFDLAAVITDEQHRFGVSQRAALEGKGFVPHTLIMSATPIPRTLALIMYGDLEVSVIDELPPGRKPIKTFLVRPNKRDDMYRFIENLAKDGKQTYIVCPAVEQNDEITDMRSAEEVIAYLEKLRMTIQYLGASDCKLQEGSMRADVNLSIREVGTKEFGTRTEMKNLNSFKAIARAIEGETERQIDLLESGQKVVQETRRWDDNKGESYAMRSKEDAQDYRYFPDPDLVPIVLDDAFLEEIRKRQPEFREEKMLRYKEEFDIPEYDIEIITGSKHMADIFEATVALGSQPKKVSNWLMVETLRLLKENNMDPEDIRFSPENLAKLIALTDGKAINSSVAKEVFEVMFEQDIDPEKYVEEKGLKTVNDEGALRKTIEEIVAANPQSVEDYHNGKERAIGFLVGQTMKAMKGKADPGLVNQILKELL